MMRPNLDNDRIDAAGARAPPVPLSRVFLSDSDQIVTLALDTLVRFQESRSAFRTKSGGDSGIILESGYILG